MTRRTEPDSRIDARGMRCPWPALQLGRKLRETGDVPGAMVVIIADDPRAPGELRAVAMARGWAEVPSGSAHEFRFVAPERTNG